MRTVSLKTLPRYGWAATITNGVRCVLTVLMRNTLPATAQTERNSRHGLRQCLKLIGNPLYHWSHLELRRYFGYEGYLNGDTAEEVWNLCNAKLQEDSMTVRNLIKQSNVTLICTTDDPVDSLEWHKKLAEDTTFDVQVLPAWRPDKAMNVEKPTFAAYMASVIQGQRC